MHGWQLLPAYGRQYLNVLLILAGALLAGCAINPVLELATVVGNKPALQLQDVPFFPQEEFQCGPAALAGLLGASGANVAPAALVSQVYLPARQGSLQLELVTATRRAGRIPYLLDATVAGLLAELEAGRPVLVLQNLQTRNFPAWHYAVLVGYDAAANRVYLNSGRTQALDMTAPAFLRTWDWAGRWALVSLRPGDLPAGAEPQRYIEAVAGFAASAGPAAAAPAWEAALERWPQQPRPYLALGNQQYALGDLAGAARYYQRGLAASGGDPALGNNLASVLGAMGCPRAGEDLLQLTLATTPGNSAWRAPLAQTLAELAAVKGTDAAGCAIW